MPFRNPSCPASISSVREVIALAVNAGDKQVTNVPAHDVRLCDKFRVGLSRVAPGQYTTSTTEGDGHLWIQKL